MCGASIIWLPGVRHQWDSNSAVLQYFHSSAVPEFVENSPSVAVSSVGPKVCLDTRIVHRNGGGCGRQQDVTNMQLFDSDCSDTQDATPVYSCTGTCVTDTTYPSVEVTSAGEGDYNVYFTFLNIAEDERRDFCCVLHITTPQFQSQSIQKEFTVTYSG